jgi:hypothetical protein
LLDYVLFEIFRSEVVGRPLAALLANDGARVFSVDIDSIQEYTKRPHVSPPEPNAEPSSSGEPSSSETAAAVKARRYHPRHVAHPTKFTLQQCLALSDVVISAVPSPTYKVKTEWLKDGCLCVNVAADKNFEKDVREKVRCSIKVSLFCVLMCTYLGVAVLTRCGQSDDSDASPKSVYLPFHLSRAMLTNPRWTDSVFDNIKKSSLAPRNRMRMCVIRVIQRVRD